MASVVASGFIGSPGGETVNATTRSLTLPTVADGDWLLTPPTLAGGSTTVLATGGGMSSEAAGAIATRSGYATHGYAKQLTAADSGTTITFTTSSSIKVATPWAIIRGLKAGQAPVWRTPVTGLAANPMTPPTFTAAAGKVLVHFIGIATASAAPPSVGAWTTPTGITLVQAATMGGTTGRAGAAIGAQLNENVGISGDWDSDASSSWGIIAVELEVAATAGTPGGTASGAYAYTGNATGSRSPQGRAGGGPLFPWQDPATADALYSPTPTLSTTTGSTSTISGATLVTPADARLRYRGGAGMAYGTGTPDSSCYQPSSRYPNGWGNPAVFGVTFQHTGTEFELLFKWLSAAGAGWFRISVDGQRLTDLMYDIPGTSGGSMTKTKVTFASSATRTILIEFQGVPFGGVYVGAGNSIAQAPAFTRRVIVQGDSTSAGSDGNTGGSAGTWVARWARYAGVNVDIWNQAIGGTGFTAPGTAVTIPDRLADVTSYAPDDVILWCGGNDGSTSIVTQATQWIADVKAAVPGVRPIIVGTWAPTVTASAARAARSVDLKNAAAANGAPFISPITGEVYDAAGVLVASQGPWIATSEDVAAYVYTGDNVHPTDAGHAYIAKRMLQAMQALDQPGGYEYTGTATGSTPAAGTATGAYSFGGTAAGERSSAGTAGGGYQFGGTATGSRTSDGTATGGYAYSSTATGARASGGSASGSYSYASSATGTAPSVDGASGAATGTYQWSGAATGGRDSAGTAAGNYAYTGTAIGAAPAVDTASGTASGAYAYAGSATGARPSAGQAAGAYTFTGTATGANGEVFPIPAVLTLTGAAPTRTLLGVAPSRTLEGKRA